MFRKINWLPRNMVSPGSRLRYILLFLSILLLTSAACTRSMYGARPWSVSSPPRQVTFTPTALNSDGPLLGGPVVSPTPNPPRVLPTPRASEDQYIVQPNDTLGKIAQRYGVPLAALINANKIANPDLVEVGQILVIPAAAILTPGPDFKIIPDSELVYSPATIGFDLEGYVRQKNGYLHSYRETLDNRVYTGAGVIQRVAEEFSVNPRLLLAVLEFRSGWVTQANPVEQSLDYPLQFVQSNRKGLYRQLSWAANQLNRGYYLWRANAVSNWILLDGSVVPLAPTLNAGTAGVQQFFALLYGLDDWMRLVGPNGFIATYTGLFGYPFDYTYEPLLPPGLTQPEMQLPFERGDVWSFTGGPHGGWADGSAWAALDFAPPGEALGCVRKDSWVVASADGLILRADIGEVIQDLDGDGHEQTGWTLFYMHIESRERVRPGTYLKAGERIGYASCEGGYSTGTHLHIARRYNGEWIPADGSLPFNLDGWISKGDRGIEYNGFLIKNGTIVEAWEGRRPENQITR